MYYGNRVAALAKNIVAKAVRNGVLIPQPCAVCGIFGFDAKGRRLSHGHHGDYRKPLDVTWLCDPHHQDWHKNHFAFRTDDESVIENAERILKAFTYLLNQY